MKTISCFCAFAALLCGCTFGGQFQTASATGSGGDDSSSANATDSSSTGMGGSSTAGTGGSAPQMPNSDCGSLKMNECGKSLLFHDACVYVPAIPTTPCTIDGQSATCDGNFVCGGNDTCVTNSDCPYKQNATWRCVNEINVNETSVDYHKCKYMPNVNACAQVLAGDDFCKVTNPMANLWYCGEEAAPEATAGNCTQPAKDTVPSKWCCVQ